LSREDEQVARTADRDREQGGAGGSIATRQVAKAAPDGYTLGLGGTGTHAINPTLYPNVGYDPRKDFRRRSADRDQRAGRLVNTSVPGENDRSHVRVERRVDRVGAGAAETERVAVGAAFATWRVAIEPPPRPCSRSRSAVRATCSSSRRQCAPSRRCRRRPHTGRSA